MPTLQQLQDTFRAQPIDGSVNLAGYDPAATPFIDSKKDAKSKLYGDLHDELFDRHELLYAEAERSVLLVLQGLDSSGKNGTIKHVVRAMNPAGVRVASFKQPTDEELDHHFLWRYEQGLPSPGQLGVFDRSHYEDVIVPMVDGSEEPETIEERIAEINRFESDLLSNGTTVVKCLLHISYDEQRERFLRRLRRDDKRWKFSESDLETRRLWDEFQAAYGSAVAQTSPDKAPWYVIPADNKWYRNWAIAKLLIAVFEDMDPAYPQPNFDIVEMSSRLEVPN